MSWIESHQSLGGHPKKDQLAELLWGAGLQCDVADAAAIGILHRLWWWALDYAKDGDLSHYSDAVIAKGCHWGGDATLLVAALTEARFVDRNRRLHDWEDYAGRLIDKRDQDALRKREGRRAAKKEPTHGASTGRPLDAPVDDLRGGARTYLPTDLKPIASPADAGDALFDTFWTTYPRRVGKVATRKLWDKLSQTDRKNATLAAEQVAAQVRASGRMLQYVQHPSTFIGPARPFVDWVAGTPPGYAGEQAAGTKCEQCPNDEMDLTWDESGQHCPLCGWRAP